MPIHETILTGGAPVKVFTDTVEDAARQQLGRIGRLPIIAGHVAAMPDVHYGRGATVGSVIATRGALIPAAVGVDIGCGMAAARLSLRAEDLPDNLRPVRDAIEDRIPVGKRSHPRPARAAESWEHLAGEMSRIVELHPKIGKMVRNIDELTRNQLGTLGSGNHFVEITIDQDQDVWIMLHSGSRGVGNAIGRYFTELARTDMMRLDRKLPEDRDLCYFEEGAAHFNDYANAVAWGQRYARANRAVMIQLILDALRATLPRFEIVDEVVECHHNYVTEEEHFNERVYVTRKGAIRARENDRGIIPGSMGTRSYIVRGLGSADSFCSAPHGAGRRMSRTEAKKRFDAADMIEQTAGVECRKDAGVADEAPGAYKDIDEVMRHAADLVRIEHTLRQVVCVKG